MSEAARPSRRAALRWLGGLGGLVGAPSLMSRSAAAAQKVGQGAADFSLLDFKRVPTRLSELRGKIVVLDFFASWCEPCKKELPALEKLHRELSPSGVVFLGINLDREQANAAEMVKRFGLSFKVLLDPEGKVAEAYDPPKMPSSYVIDKTGVLRFVNQGYDGAGDIARLRQQIGELTR
jgi:cytochrome c biogenesis protein CcmG/thiol:disulfide interchange protein DsbE